MESFLVPLFHITFYKRFTPEPVVLINGQQGAERTHISWEKVNQGGEMVAP